MNFDLIWSRATRVAMFLMGAGIMGYQTIGAPVDRPWLIAAALGMMGLPIARSLESVMTRLPQGQDAPSTKEKE